jgi:uncharacterized cupredoxin-like copper-binding protein
MKRHSAAVLAVLAVLVVAAGGTALATTSATRLSLHAASNGDLRFNVKRLTARHGVVTLVMRNPSASGLDHGIAVEGKHVDKDGKIVAPGKNSVLTVSLKPGRYEFYCPVPGHKAAGMRGTLVVK